MDHFTLTSCVTSCVVICAIFSIIIKFGQRRHRYKQASKFPGPPTLPFIGNAHLFTGSTEAVLDKFVELGKLYPAPYRIWWGNYLTFVVNTPQQLKVVLNSPKTINKGNLIDLIRPWLGTGLLTASEPKWLVHRKLIQPTFSATILQSFVEVFSAQSLIMAKELEANLDEPEFNIYNYTSQFTMHAICETAMGANMGEQSNDYGCYAKALEKFYLLSPESRMKCHWTISIMNRPQRDICIIFSGVIDSIGRRAASPWLHPYFVFRRTELGKNQQKQINFLHNFTDNLIQTKKKRLLEQNGSPGSDDIEENTGSLFPRRKVFIDHLIEISRGNEVLSDEELRAEVDTMMGAGTHTTSITIAFAMIMLASHSEIQEKVYQELCEIYKEDDGEKPRVTPEDLSRMTYLERVIKETMRLFPTGPLLIRTVTDDLKIGEDTFPAGSLVFLSVIELHRNRNIWPDPLKFDPDRFLPEEVAKRESYSYLPFSGGPRICIGSKYAMMSMKTFLATILQKYVLLKDNITPVKDVRLKLDFMLKPVEPLTLRIERRPRITVSRDLAFRDAVIGAK